MIDGTITKLICTISSNWQLVSGPDIESLKVSNERKVQMSPTASPPTSGPAAKIFAGIINTFNFNTQT